MAQKTVQAKGVIGSGYVKMFVDKVYKNAFGTTLYDGYVMHNGAKVCVTVSECNIKGSVPKVLVSLHKSATEVDTHEFNPRTNRMKTEVLRDYCLEVKVLDAFEDDALKVIFDGLEGLIFEDSGCGGGYEEVNGLQYGVMHYTVNRDEWLDGKEGKRAYAKLKEALKVFNKPQKTA